MTFDESNAYLTNELCGRTIARVERQGKDLVLVCTCGHEIVIRSDINHDIHYVKTNVKIAIPGIDLTGLTGVM